MRTKKTEVDFCGENLSYVGQNSPEVRRVFCACLATLVEEESIVETWADQLRQSGVAQRRVCEATGRDPSEICRQLNGHLPLTGDTEAACRRLIRAAKVERARAGLEAARELLPKL
jgi:hypothetical protein